MIAKTPAAPPQWRAALTAGPAAPGIARRTARTFTRAWGIPADPDVAALLTSELVTNAVMHEPGAYITLSLECRDGGLRVTVHDSSPFLPVLVKAMAWEETGRGLALVDRLASSWGYYRTPGGKAVWFTLGAGP